MKIHYWDRSGWLHDCELRRKIGWTLGKLPISGLGVFILIQGREEKKHSQYTKINHWALNEIVQQQSDFDVTECWLALKASGEDSSAMVLSNGSYGTSGKIMCMSKQSCLG